MARKEKKQSGLSIPDAPFRPGEEAAFESWPWKPGDLDRPDPTKCEAEETSAHADGLVRVLGDDNKAQEHGIPVSAPTICARGSSTWSD